MTKSGKSDEVRKKDVEGLSCEFEVTVYLLLVPSSRAERLKEKLIRPVSLDQKHPSSITKAAQ